MVKNARLALGWLFALLLLLGAWPAVASDWLDEILSGADEVGAPEGEPPVYPLYEMGERVGYVFETIEFAPVNGHLF